MTFICVLTQMPHLCFGCGEWLHVDHHNGYEGPHGNRFCTPECVVEFKKITRRIKSDWCPQCGFDNHEHQPGCVNETSSPSSP